MSKLPTPHGGNNKQSDLERKNAFINRIAGVYDVNPKEAKYKIVHERYEDDAAKLSI